ncbi:hypothetical protein TNCV_4897951 [Trichonephila clavipes]|nr:hypothetical protein TNCV_4897951 [Trichonephila clavipes]
MGYNQIAKRGKPSNTSIEQMLQTKRCKRTAQSVPCKEFVEMVEILGHYGQKREYGASFQTARVTLQLSAQSY